MFQQQAEGAFMRKLLAAAATLLCAQFFTIDASAANLVAKINLSTQTMTVIQDGRTMYRWKVSTARSGYRTPTGSYSAKWLSKNHRSRKYNNAPMPFSIFFNGGYAVHGTTDIRRLGTPASHGCVRLHPQNAAVLYSLTQANGLSNTRIIIQR
jgi:lipoprotein-anchoring transpeptidase ErfK/SrfK